jgi:hypothetical protein
MRGLMTKESRIEVSNLLRDTYQQAFRDERVLIINELVRLTNFNRKHAIRVLNRKDAICLKPRKRTAKYDEELKQALIQVWVVLNRIASKRMVPFLPEIVPHLEKSGHLVITDKVREKLLSISVSTADRLLKEERKKLGRPRSTTKPGTLLKSQIPVHKYGDWRDDVPGFLEADLVAHCGPHVGGKFINTLTATDVATGWTELLAIQSITGTLNALKRLPTLFPFPVRGLDTDNGREFINFQTLKWCRKQNLQFTRGREGEKDDQAHVEEKNGSIVRRFVGYDRYEGRRSCRLLNELYSACRLYVNFFQPSMKLIEKERDGAKVKKRYAPAATPFQRLLSSKILTDERQEELNSEYESLDPVALLERIEKLQEKLWYSAVRLPHREIPKDSLLSILSDQSTTTEAVIAALQTHRDKLQTRQHQLVSTKAKSSNYGSTISQVLNVIREAPKSTVFSVERLTEVTEKLKPRNIKSALVRLAELGALIRVRRGRYSLNPDYPFSADSQAFPDQDNESKRGRLSTSKGFKKEQRGNILNEATPMSG